MLFPDVFDIIFHLFCAKIHYIKLAVDQDVNHVVVTNLVPVVTELLPVLYAEFLSLEVEDTCQSFIAFDSPPKQTGVPLFVYHCTYLI